MQVLNSRAVSGKREKAAMMKTVKTKNAKAKNPLPSIIGIYYGIAINFAGSCLLLAFRSRGASAGTPGPSWDRSSYISAMHETGKHS
jgi:hypothetical protein